MRFHHLNILLVTFIGQCAGLHEDPSPSPCLPYEPAQVVLSGRVRLDSQFGAPNYGETPGIDEKIIVPVLVLSTPVDVCGSTADTGNVPAHNVTEIQLDLTALRPAPPPPENARITARGAFYHGFSGYHYTDVVLRVKRIRTAR